MAAGPPELPPRIDRANKPPRSAASRSAQERLFGGGSKDNNDPPNYINATPHHRPANSSLERHNPNKTVRIYIKLIQRVTLIFEKLSIYKMCIF